MGYAKEFLVQRLPPFLNSWKVLPRGCWANTFDTHFYCLCPSVFRIASSISTLPSVEPINKELPQVSSENFAVASLCLQHRPYSTAQPTFYLTDVGANNSFAHAVFRAKALAKGALAGSSPTFLEVTLPPRNSSAEAYSCQKNAASVFIYHNHEISARVDGVEKRHEGIQPEIVVQVVVSGEQSPTQLHGKGITVVYRISEVSNRKRTFPFLQLRTLIL